jgi:hypothetical protein
VKVDDEGMEPELIELLARFSAEYDERCRLKKELGEEKYGTGTWLGIDTLEHAMDEIVDLGNYARFTFIKLRFLQEKIHTIIADATTASPLPGKANLGKDAIFNPGRPQ